MSAHLIGYARVSTNVQDLSSQRAGLEALGVPIKHVYVDHGLTGRTKRLARAPRGASRMPGRNVRLSLGGSIHDPAGEPLPQIPTWQLTHHFEQAKRLLESSPGTTHRERDPEKKI